MTARRRRTAAGGLALVLALCGWAGRAWAATAPEVWALLDADRWREALDGARVGFDAAPGDPAIRGALGEACFRAGLLREAESVLAPLDEDDRAPARGLITLARLREASGDAVSADALAERAVAADEVESIVLFRAAEVIADRSRSRTLLLRYLDRADDDDDDRREAARGSLRILEALGDRAVWIPEERPERIVADLDVLTDSEGRATAFVVTAALGSRGRRVRLLLDSGSGGLFVVRRKTRKAGFEPLGDATTFGGGGDQRHATRHGVVPVFDLDGLRFREALLTSTPREFSAHGEFHGVLGVGLFEGYLVRLDLAAGRLELVRGGSLDGEGERYWVLSGQMLVRAGVADGEGGLFLFDTGATRSVLDLAFVEGVEGARIGPAAQVRGFGGLVEGARVVEGIALDFQGHRGTDGGLRAIDLSLRGRLGGVNLSGYLGLDVLRDRVIEIDTRARRLRVSEATPRD